MSKPKGAAKAAPAKKRARKAVKDVVAPAVVVGPTDWPPGLVEKEVESFFNAVESGDFTVKTAASRMGRKGQEVYRWALQYPRFGARLEEAIDIGRLMAEDTYRDITATDKNTAAAAMVRFTGIDRWLKVKRPKIYNTSAFKPMGDENASETIVGVVLVPMRSDSAGQVPHQRAAIEGTATQIQRLPVDAAPAPPFKVRAGE